MAKKKSVKKGLIIGISSVVVLLAAAYAGVGYYFHDHFYPGTVINETNFSLGTVEAAEAKIKEEAEDYLLEVKARNLKSQSINGKLIGYRYVSDGIRKEYYLQVAFENGAVEELHVSLSTYNKAKAGASKILTLQKGFFGLPVITKGL